MTEMTNGINKLLEEELLQYRALLQNSITISNKITFLLENAKGDYDNAVTRRLETIRNEQKEVEKEINEFERKFEGL